MKCYQHPQHDRIIDPYPSQGLQVVGFAYQSALVLVRPKTTTDHSDTKGVRNTQDADYLVGRPFQCCWTDQYGQAHEITVPAGMVTDLTSVPNWLRWYVGRVGPWLEAAIVHDFLYIAWQDIEGRTAQESDRKFADAIMRAAMYEAAVDRWRRAAIYLAVRTFGMKSYRKRHSFRYADLHDPALEKQICLGGLHLRAPGAGCTGLDSDQSSA